MAVPDGWTLFAQGRQAEVFLRSDGTVVKLMRNPSDRAWIEREVVAIDAVGSASLRVPTRVEAVEADGRPGLAMNRVDGTDLLVLLGRRPWLTFAFGTRMGALHAALNELPAPSALPELHHTLAGEIDRAADLTDAQRRRARAALDALPTGDRLCHGDLHLGNLIGDPANPVVIDWGAATRGNPDADVALTVLMHRMAKPGPGSPPVVRALAPIGGRILWGRYLRAYRRVRTVDAARLEQWISVRAAARLAHDIGDERDGLLAIVACGFGD